MDILDQDHNGDFYYRIAINRGIPATYESPDDKISRIRADILEGDDVIGSIWLRLLDFTSSSNDEEYDDWFLVADESGDTAEMAMVFFDEEGAPNIKGLPDSNCVVLFLDAFYIEPNYRGIKGLARNTLSKVLLSLDGQFDFAALNLIPFELGGESRNTEYGRKIIHPDPVKEAEKIQIQKEKLAGFYSSLSFVSVDFDPDWMYLKSDSKGNLIPKNGVIDNEDGNPYISLKMVIDLVNFALAGGSSCPDKKITKKSKKTINQLKKRSEHYKNPVSKDFKRLLRNLT